MDDDLHVTWPISFISTTSASEIVYAFLWRRPGWHSRKNRHVSGARLQKEQSACSKILKGKETLTRAAFFVLSFSYYESPRDERADMTVDRTCFMRQQPPAAMVLWYKSRQSEKRANNATCRRWLNPFGIVTAVAAAATAGQRAVSRKTNQFQLGHLLITWVN